MVIFFPSSIYRKIFLCLYGRDFYPATTGKNFTSHHRADLSLKHGLHGLFDKGPLSFTPFALLPYIAQRKEKRYMSQSKDMEGTIPVTIHLKTHTIEKLFKISSYLSLRNNEEKPVEYVIKAAIADYLDVMLPTSGKEKKYIKSLLFDGPKYVIKNRFKEIMEQKNIKAVQIHRNTDISESNLSQILNNKNQNMTLDSFLRIWIALDCPPIADCLYRENLDQD